MPWSTSGRRAHLPANWEAIRRRVLARDGHRCMAAMRDGSRCPATATDVDHIARGDDHTMTNLQSLCAWHHKRKTAAESGAARRRHPRDRRTRPSEAHPGLL